MKYGRLDAWQANELGYLPATVFLNGEPINNVYIMDDIKGEVIVYESDDHGRILLNESGDVNLMCAQGEVTYIPNRDTPRSQGKNLYTRFEK